MTDEYTLYFDGGLRQKSLTYGCILKNNEALITKSHGKIPIHKLSSNVAEYIALIIGLTVALQNDVKKITVYGDSELIINQMTGKYKTKSPHLKLCKAIATALSKEFEEVEFHWIPRKQNAEVDKETRSV